MKKKLFSIALSAALILGSVNVTTLAAETEQYGTNFLVDVISEAQEDAETEIPNNAASDIVTEERSSSDEQAEEDENVGFDLENVSEQAIEKRTEEETAKQSVQEDLRDDTESEEFSDANASEGEPSKPINVKGKIAGVYQFGDAPSKRSEISAYSMRAGANENITAAEEYVYQQIMQRNENIDVSAYHLSQEDAGMVLAALINDRPELYFVENSWGATIGGDGTCIRINLIYDDTLSDDAFYEAVDAALSGVNSGMSDLEKAIVLHDYLAVNCEYDYDNYSAGANSIPATSYSAYGTLVYHTAVCQGYALAYKYLLNQVGIECYLVTSNDMDHAWNLVVLNGNYYQVDVTWDDPVRDLVGRAKHSFMFCSDDAFQEREHYNWVVTKGASVVNYSATDTSYDNAFWSDSNSPLILSGDQCYYTTYDSTAKTAKIKKADLSDVTAAGEDVCDIGVWPVWESSSFYQSVFSGLFCVNDRLYYNDKESIYGISLDGSGKTKKFTADITQGYIYGSAFCGGKVYYSLHESPNINQKETRLEAVIDFSSDNTDAKAYLTCLKTKTAYRYGESINLDDLRVMYHGTDGTIRRLSDSEYTTNAQSIDPFVSGAKSLVITYIDGSDTLTVEVALTVSQKEEGGTEESSSAEESSMPESNSAEESSSTEESSMPESSSVEESSVPESSSVEKSSVPESSSVEESSNTSESSGVQESSGASESSNAPESSEGAGSSSVEESSEPESSSTEESDTQDDRIDLNTIGVTVSKIKAKVYDGNAYEPVVKVTAMVDGKKTTLTEGADYAINYTDNTNVGTGSVTITGMDDYKGTIVAHFTITPKSMKKLKVITGSIAGTASVSDLTKLVHVYDGTKLLEAGKDYNLSDYKAIKASSSQVTVTAAANSNYTGSVSAKFTVYESGAKIINPEHVELNKGSVPYTGKAIKDVEPIVTVNGVTLHNGKDYKVQYQNNKEAGTAFIIVTGKGEYKGKVVVPFAITAATSNPMEIKTISDKTYNGKLQKPTVSVTVKNADGKSKKLAKKDYTVIYENNFHAGTATITVNGKGNYAGLSKVVTFTIKQQEIKKASVKGTQGNLTLTYSKRKLKEGRDYTIQYGEINKNKIKVTFTGKGDFTGVVEKSVKVK